VTSADGRERYQNASCTHCRIAARSSFVLSDTILPPSNQSFTLKKSISRSYLRGQSFITPKRLQCSEFPFSGCLNYLHALFLVQLNRIIHYHATLLTWAINLSPSHQKTPPLSRQSFTFNKEFSCIYLKEK
jgi:hypothetical protein